LNGRLDRGRIGCRDLKIRHFKVCCLKSQILNISVIVPVLNEATRIAALIAYLQEHGGPMLREILVVDGGSSDDTAECAKNAGAGVLLCPVKSRAAQMNCGARAAAGDILYFIHADTFPPPSFAVDIAGAISTGYGMGCYRYRFDSRRILLKINAYFNRFPWLWCQGGDKTFFIRKILFEQHGGFDEYYVIMEEYDFLRRTMSKIKFYTIPKYATVSARKYENNSWLRVQLANALVFNLFKMGVNPVKLKTIYKKMIY
jgi:rSAM/selenodomain-associated transferase 2